MELTLVSINSHKSSEFYVSQEGGILRFKQGKWSSDCPIGNFDSLDASRHHSLSQEYHKWLSVQPHRMTGLEQLILPELAAQVAHYLAAIISCPMPTPAADVHDQSRHLLNLDGLHARGEVFPDLCVTDKYDIEYWSTSDLADYIYLGAHSSTGIGLWEQDLGEGRANRCPPLHNLLLSTRRQQVLGLPLR